MIAHSVLPLLSGALFQNDIWFGLSLSSPMSPLKTYLFHSVYKNCTFYFDLCRYVRGLAVLLVFVDFSLKVY